MIYIKDRLLKKMGNIELIGLDYKNNGVCFCIYLKDLKGKLFHRDIFVSLEESSNFFDFGSFCGVAIENSYNEIMVKMKGEYFKKIE